MKIIVLAGGLSTERNVALTSGTGICRALRRRGHRAVLVDMFLGLESYTGKIEDIFDAPDGLCADHSVSSDAPDLEAVRRSRRDQSPSMLGQGVLQVCAMADLVFLALHGSCGEDGRIQATLDLLGVPYTGSNYVSSGMAMDKAITKRFMDAEGIRTAPWHDVRYTEADIPALVEKLETPCAVKIVNGGSSIGVELPDTKEELAGALRRMLQYGDHVVVEKKIKGREIQVLEIADLTTLADYFVLCTGSSNTQINALVDNVEKVLTEQAGEEPLHREGYRGGTWVLLDYGCIAVHVFSGEAREFYGLERLWRDGKSVDLAGVVTDGD